MLGNISMYCARVLSLSLALLSFWHPKGKARGVGRSLETLRSKSFQVSRVPWRVSGGGARSRLRSTLLEISPTLVVSGASTPFSRKPAIPPTVDYAETKEGTSARGGNAFSRYVGNGEIRPDFGRSFRQESSSIHPPRGPASRYRKLLKLFPRGAARSGHGAVTDARNDGRVPQRIWQFASHARTLLACT